MRALLAVSILILFAPATPAAIVSTTGTVMEELSPYPPEDDNTIFVFTEQTGVAFVATQTLDFGSIDPGTLVDSHYVQYDPVTPAALVGTGSITFDGPILGVITLTANLNLNLAPDVAATSDEYFGLATSLGPYPTGAIPSARGLGSPEDDLLVTIGDPTLTIDSLEIPAGGAGNLDGFRVLTASPTAVPTMTEWARWIAMVVLIGIITWGARNRRRTDPFV